MADTEVILSGIEYKIRKLIEENLRYKKKVNDQKEEIVKLHQQVQDLKEKNLSLTEQINKKIMADSFSTEEEIEEGRKRIKTLMQEIEQCIALVNK